MDTPRFDMWRVKDAGQNLDHLGVREAYNRAKAARAEIIDAATLVELELNDYLRLAISGSDKPRGEMFSNCVLTAEFCTLFQKWRMLRTILSSTSDELPDRSEQLANLKLLISMRNAFAHGEIVVDAETLVTTLWYREGERKSIRLDSDAVSSILDNALASFRWINSLVRNMHMDMSGEL